MAVEVQRDADAGVAEALLNHLRVNARCERERGRRVSEVVEADSGNPSGFDAAVECVGKEAWMRRLAGRRGEDEIVRGARCRGRVGRVP